MTPSLLLVAALIAAAPPTARCEPPTQWQTATSRPGRDQGCPVNPQILPSAAHHEVIL